MSKEKVMSIIQNESGKQFDPDAVKAFLKISEKAWEDSLSHGKQVLPVDL